MFLVEGLAQWGAQFCDAGCILSNPKILTNNTNTRDLKLKFNGTLHYPNPNDIDKSLNDAAADKIRKYSADYNNNPPNTMSFIPFIPSTSGRLHSEFIRLLFLQAHRETDRFFEIQEFSQHNQTSLYSHLRRASLTSILKSK
jgi:hypothetical protein